MRGLQRIHIHWPLAIAGVFTLFVLVSTWSLYSTQMQLRAATNARLQADSIRRAAVLDDFLSGQTKLAAELADSREVQDYLQNRALGMSPRYGLNANLEYIQRLFERTIALTVLHNRPVVRGLAFRDGNDNDIVAFGAPPSRARGVSPRPLTIDTGSGSIDIAAPVNFKTAVAGSLTLTLDLRALSRQLIGEDDADGGYHEFLLVGDGESALTPDNAFSRLDTTARSLSGLPPDVLTTISDASGAAGSRSFVALRTPIKGAPLSLLTLTSETTAYGRFSSPIYSLLLAALPVALFLLLLAFERQRRRAARLETDIADAAERRAELARHNTELSEEIVWREQLEEDLRAKTAALNEMNADLRIAATAFEAQEGMLVTDAARRILRINSAFSEISGFAPADLVGRSISILRATETPLAVYSDLLQETASRGRWQGDIWLKTKSGAAIERWLTISAVRDDRGSISHYIGTYYDLSERRRAEEKIRELAFYDQLTGLPNRAILIERVRHAMTACREAHTHAAMLFIDFDNFKRLNDTLGHHKGDLFLRRSAERLKQCLRETDTVSRFGGDEFVILLADLGAPDLAAAALRAEGIAQSIIEAMSEPHDLEGSPYRTTASAGVALFHDDNQSIDDLLKRADMAMYEAKTAGRNAVRFFDPAMQTLIESRAGIEAELREDIAAGRFLLHYQPQVDQDGRITGAEALLRWPRSDRHVSPADVIAVAESSALMISLGNGVLGAACAQLADWANDPRLAELSLAVNVSGVQLHDPGFVDHVLAAVDRTGADPRRLKLEVTESFEIQKIGDVIEKMARLRDFGITFSLDDFGTGYSSLSYLKRLPIDQLKIDQSFVRDILVDPNDAAIAETIIALGATLRLSVIAEGVETEEQRAFLEKRGCRGFQGYLFARPMPAPQFVEFAKAFSGRNRPPLALSA
ncbi:MAG: EAL domain-containing protein [Hyphomicrobiales bacterium]|nr:EAL domain-containing protein [Hyphomicrobiales bacterium]